MNNLSRAIRLELPFRQIITGKLHSLFLIVNKVVNIITAPSQESFQLYLFGPILTIVVIAVLSLIQQDLVMPPPPFASLHLLVMLSAFIGGLRSALNTAAIIWLYASVVLSQGEPFTYTDLEYIHLLNMAVTLPLTALIAGVFKHRSNLLTKESIKRIHAERLANSFRESELQYRLLFELNPNPMWLYDLQTLKFLAVNKAATRHYGYSEKEFLGMTLLDIRRKEDIQEILDYHKNLKTSDLSAIRKAGMWKHKTKKGTIIEVETTISTVEFMGKQAQLVLVNDITERKRMENLKQEFFSIAAHELKTPITTLRLLTQSYRRAHSEGKNRPLDISEVLMLDKELTRLNRLVNDIFDAERLESGKLSLHKTKVNLRDLIEDIIRQMQIIAPHHKIVYTKKRLCILSIDADRVTQVVINLVSNAIKHSPPGSKISLKLNKNQKYVEVSVQDHGEGIPKDKLKLIFERFFQAHEHPKDGIGLGLYISKEIVELHKGKIWVESELGKGSTFYFTLPCD